jgi:hypothetical protein
MRDPYVIHGRPDFRDPDFGITYAKKFPPYVFSIRGASALIHRVRRVRLRWWEVAGHGEKLVKQNKPRMTAECMCGQFFSLQGSRSRTCHVPAPDALLCGRCHGEGPVFSKDGWATREGITRHEAHVKLGCVVKGY